MRPHFGLGDATKIEAVRIEWPSGTVQELTDTLMNKIHTVTELPKVQSLGGGALRVLDWKESDYTIEASDDLKSWRAIGKARGGSDFTDAESSGVSHRFYRASRAP